ncbi:hypothetical protein GCM10027049_18680 [Mucilaginibacter puniceus]
MLDVIKKLKFRGDGIIIDAPAALATEFIKHGFKTSFAPETQSANTLIFVNNKEEFLNFLNTRLTQIEFDSVLWFAYPKGTSKIKTDINRDMLWKLGEEFGITSVAAISINETWSALRFRPIDRVGK